MFYERDHEYVFMAHDASMDCRTPRNVALSKLQSKHVLSLVGPVRGAGTKAMASIEKIIHKYTTNRSISCLVSLQEYYIEYK